MKIERIKQQSTRCIKDAPYTSRIRSVVLANCTFCFSILLSLYRLYLYPCLLSAAGGNKTEKL